MSKGLSHWEEVRELGLQIVNVIGNATKDAERKVSKDGVSYVTFRLATTGAGDKTTFYNVVVFGHYGEILQEFITKGREVFVSGRQEVNEKGFISVIADHVELLRYPKAKAEPEPKKIEKVKVGRPKKAK
jgi:hypothetical protein